MDGEEVDNDKGGTMGNTRAEGIEDVGQTAQTARYKAEGARSGGQVIDLLF